MAFALFGEEKKDTMEMSALDAVMGEKKGFKTFEQHLEARYGKIGDKKRDQFEISAKAFMVGEMIKEARKSTGVH